MRFLQRRGRKKIEPAKWGLKPARQSKREQSYLVGIAVATVLLWQFPIGSTLLYPFTLLATWFHEMGHGLAAAALGGDFEQLVIFPDGSGYARYSSSADMMAITHALIAAAGLLGPSLAGAIMIAGSRSKVATRWLLAGLGIVLVLSTLIWVRSLAGWIVLPAFAVATLLVALSGRERLQRFTIELLGVQAAISVWRDVRYLFSEGAFVGGQYAPSDTAAIEDALLLPYWIWGGLITVAIVGMIWSALRFAVRD
jgi:hypothetical protein